LKPNYGWRLELGQHGGNIPLRRIRDLLADYSALGSDAKENPAALAIQKGAEGLAGPRELTRGFLDFRCLRLASGHQLV
jgi:hypothetical protein